MTPEEKYELLKMLIERGVEMRTRRKLRRIVAIERENSQVVLRFEDGSTDKIHVRDFARRRFVAVI